MKSRGEKEDLEGSGVLKAVRNEELPFVFVFPVFTVIQINCQFEPFSVYTFLHTNVKSLGQEKKLI